MKFAPLLNTSYFSSQLGHMWNIISINFFIVILQASNSFLSPYGCIVQHGGGLGPHMAIEYSKYALIILY